MPEPLLAARGLLKRYGGLVATNDVSLDVATGEIHALIGPNGAGKTTLVAQLAGEVIPDAGTVRFAGVDITREAPYRRALHGLVRSFQITTICPEFSVLDNVGLAVQAHAGHSFRFWRSARRDRLLREPARHWLEVVGLSDRAHVQAATLAHGEKRTLEVAMALATRPRMLLLDEPMAGAGPEDAVGMVQLLAGLKGQQTILLVEHDMDAVFALADTITVLVRGRVIASGPPDVIRQDSAVLEAYLGEDA
jgi:branched-chain amino acid transport system ATP-binding protein